MFKTIVEIEIFNKFLCMQQQQRREREKKRKGRVGSRNNVTQLKIQYTDVVVVYQMENHTRISLSIHHNGIYGDREKELRQRVRARARMQSDDETMIGDNSNKRNVTIRECVWLRFTQYEKRAEEIENDFIAPAWQMKKKIKIKMRNLAPETKREKRKKTTRTETIL